MVNTRQYTAKQRVLVKIDGVQVEGVTEFSSKHEWGDTVTVFISRDHIPESLYARFPIAEHPEWDGIKWGAAHENIDWLDDPRYRYEPPFASTDHAATWRQREQFMQEAVRYGFPVDSELLFEVTVRIAAHMDTYWNEQAAAGIANMLIDLADQGLIDELQRLVEKRKRGGAV